MDRQLYNAVRCGDESFIRELQSSDETTLPKVTPQTGTVLHVAARFRKTEIAKLILEKHTSLIGQKNSKGDTPLHIAARIGDSEMVRLLVNREVPEIDQEVDEADEKLVQIINMKGETALHDAVRGGHLEVVKLLIEKDPLLATVTTGGGESPLFLAVERMHREVAAHILSILSDDAPSRSFWGPNGMNALHAAVIRSCDLEGDNSGWTALHHAAYQGEQGISEELLSTDNSNSIAYARDEEGLTAFHIAARNGEVDTMRLLAEICPNIWELVDNKGQTAFHVAANIGYAHIVEFILKEVPDDIINQQDKEGNSSLHLAALGGNRRIVKLLIDDGRVDKTAINNKGVSFMDILLSMKGHPKLPRKVIRDTSSLEGITKRRKQRMLSVNEVGQRNNNIPAFKDNDKDDEEVLEAKELAADNLVVATVIAGASFTAAATMPGGYKTDGHDGGMAILGHNASFKAFVVANSVAFAFSMGSLFGHFFTFRGRRFAKPEAISVLISYSLFWLLVAFITGSYAVLADYRRLSISVVVLTPVFFLFANRIYLGLEGLAGQGEQAIRLLLLATHQMAELFGYVSQKLLKRSG